MDVISACSEDLYVLERNYPKISRNTVRAYSPDVFQTLPFSPSFH